MENLAAITSMDHHHQTELELPPGFRFHPTDEELVTYYLYPKVMDNNYSTIIIGEVDLNNVEPWELPWRAKMGEKEWYFYSKRDRKYTTGSRTNRASNAGYWKTTGKDKDIFNKKKMIFGMKKTLVFYKGRAPNGVKTNWVMHEYRFVGNFIQSIQSSNAEKNEWALCRIFKKSPGGNKVDISSMINDTYEKDYSISSNLHTLIDLSSDDENPKTIMAVDSPPFLIQNNPLEKNLIISDYLPNSSSMAFDFSHHLQLPFPKITPQNFMLSSQFMPSYGENFMQEQSILELLQQNANLGFSWDNDMYCSMFNHHQHVDFDCMWY